MSAAALGAGLDQDRDRLMLQDQSRIMEQICKDRELSQEEIAGITREVKRSFQAAGDVEPIRSMIRTAKTVGCRGECLVESLRLHTRSMEQGYSAGEAQSMIRREIRNCVRESTETGISDEELAQRLRIRVETRILARAHEEEGGSSKSDGMREAGAAGSRTQGTGDSGSDDRGSGGHR
jgi:hypothetical protein